MTKVSVIVPVHNTARFLEQCIGSVAAQTLPADDVELIAVDDGSTDDSLDVLRRLAEGHPTWQVLHQDASGGAAAPRNAGLDHATGEYVFFLDSDDWLAPTALEAFTDLADATGSGVVVPRYEERGDDGTLKAKAFSATRRAVDFIDSGAYRLANPRKLFRRSLIEENHLRFPTGYAKGEDLPFVTAAYLLSPHVDIAADETYYFLRWRGDGTSLRQSATNRAEFWAKTRDLIEVVVRYTSPGPRRTTLLQRPILGIGGFRAVFGYEFTTAFSAAEQRKIFDEAHALIRPIWTPTDRREGRTDCYIVSSLVWEGDFAATVEFSDMMRDGVPFRLVPRGLRRLPAYVASTGTVVKDVVGEDVLKARTKGR